MGLQRGWPDIILISPAGRFHGLELKRKGGRLSESQEDFKRWAIANGVAHNVVENLDLALAALSHWGAIILKLAPDRTIPVDIHNTDNSEESR